MWVPNLLPWLDLAYNNFDSRKASATQIISIILFLSDQFRGGISKMFFESI
jgi:hypothetical protein